VAFGNPTLNSLLVSGLTEKLVYRSMVNLKPFLAALSAIENLNTLSPFYVLGLIICSAMLGAIVNSKSFLIKDVGIGI